MRALLTAMTCEKHALEANLAAHFQLMDEAARRDCRFAVFPEFSLTGSVDPLRNPSEAVTINDPSLATLVQATGDLGVGAVFGFSERAGDECFITQAVASDGRLVATQRKRYLGTDELGYSVGSDTAVFELGGNHFGFIICAEAGVAWTWDATVRAGAEIVLFCSAPGLDDHGMSEASWRAGFEWWEGCGLADAVRNAERLRVPVAMATQAGATIDENFPGIAALVGADGTIIDRLPDWHPGTLVVDLHDGD